MGALTFGGSDSPGVTQPVGQGLEALDSHPVLPLRLSLLHHCFPRPTLVPGSVPCQAPQSTIPIPKVLLRNVDFTGGFMEEQEGKVTLHPMEEKPMTQSFKLVLFS